MHARQVSAIGTKARADVAGRLDQKVVVSTFVNSVMQGRRFVEIAAQVPLLDK